MLDCDIARHHGCWSLICGGRRTGGVAAVSLGVHKLQTLKYGQARQHKFRIPHLVTLWWTVLSRSGGSILRYLVLFLDDSWALYIYSNAGQTELNCVTKRYLNPLL